MDCNSAFSNMKKLDNMMENGSGEISLWWLLAGKGGHKTSGFFSALKCIVYLCEDLSY